MTWFKKLFGKTDEIKESKIKSEKDIATENQEPYIKIIETNIDKTNPSQGYFELDWNHYFISDLKKAGYTGTTEEEIVEKWFKQLCKNIISEDLEPQERRIT
jgi:hypothetical protein